MRTESNVPGIDRQSEDLLGIQLEELLGRIETWNQRDIARLVAPLGQVHRERRLRSPGHPGQDQIRLVKRVQVRAIVVTNGELDRLHALEIIVGEAVEETRLMARLDVKPLGHLHDQGTEQVDRHDAPHLGLAQQRVDDLPLDEAEDDDRVHLLRLLEHAAHLGDRARIPKDAQPPGLPELDHRRAHGGAARVSGSVGDDEDHHMTVLGRHAIEGSETSGTPL